MTNPVLCEPACAAMPFPLHRDTWLIATDDCLSRVDRRFPAHNAAPRPRSQSATGSKSLNQIIFSILFAPNGFALVSETGPSGATNGSAISSYQALADGTLTPVTSSAPTLGAANCWNAVTPDGRFVYVSNAGSATISGFAIGASGVLTPLPGTVLAANPSGATNLDVTVSSDGKFLYSLNSGKGTIGIFAIQKDGQLVNIGSADGISPAAGFNGIAAN